MVVVVSWYESGLCLVLVYCVVGSLEFGWDCVWYLVGGIKW